VPTEVPDLRTQNSNTWDNHDGTRTTRIATGPINYLDPATKKYEPVDTTLANVSGNKFGRVRASKMATPVEVGSADDTDGFVSLDTGEGIIRMFLAPGTKPGKSGMKPSRHGSQADVASLIGNIDLTAVVDATGVRTYFILNSAPSGPSFSIALDTGALTPVLQSDGSILFLDKKGNAAASMPVPYAVDSNVDPNVGSGKATTDVHYALHPQGKQWLLTVTVSTSYLSTATYPVYVDPSVIGTAAVWNNTVNNQSAYVNSVLKDMYSQTGYHEFLVGYDDNTGNGSQWATYLKFDLAAAGINEYPLSASLELYPWHQWYGTSSGERTNIKLVATNWSNSSITWNNAPFKSNPYPTADSSFVGLQGQWSDAANWTNGNLITTWAQGWVSSPSTNYGIYLYGASGDYHYWKRFDSSQNSSDQPYLDITYAVPTDAVISPTNNAYTSSGNLDWTYTGNGSPNQTQSQVQVSTSSGFGTTVYDSNQVSNTASNWTFSTNYLTAGTAYYWRVRSFNGYGWSDWTAGARFQFDDKSPAKPVFTAPSSSQLDISATSYTASWADSDPGFGVASYAYTWLRTPVASTNSCGTSWTTVSTGTAGGGNSGSSTISTMTTAYCYEIQVTATDYAGNNSPMATSSSILVDTRTPSLVVADNCGTIGSCYRTGNTIYFQPSAAKTITLTASVSQMPPSGICYTWSSLTSTTGWSGYAPVTTCSSTNSGTLTWSSTAVQTSLTVTATSGAGKSSSVAITFTPDSGAQVGWTTPVSGDTNPVVPGPFSVAWTETAGLSPITARSLQRLKVGANTNGSCPSSGWVTDGSPISSPSPISQTLSTLTCYEWVLTLTDSLGTHQFTSAPVSVDTGPVASISAPTDNQAFSGNITITGTASDDYLASCTLQYGPGSNPSPSSLTTITSSCPLTTNGPLVQWAPNGLTGAYTIILTVTNGAGAKAQDTVLVYLDNTDRGSETHFGSVPFDLQGGWKLGVNVASGEGNLSRDFFSISSYGPAQALSLIYNSNDTSTSGKFGVGWSSNLTQHLSFESGFIVWHEADGSLVPFGQVGGYWAPIAGHYETLSSAAGSCGQAESQCRIKLPDQSSLTFEGSGSGRLLAITDRFGNSLSLSWSSDGSSATATDASNRATSISVNANNEITSVTDSAGRVWGFAYGSSCASNQLCTITDDAGNVTTFAYDGSGRLSSIDRTLKQVGQDPTDIKWSIAYSAGKVVSVTDPYGASFDPVESTSLSYATGETTVVQPRDPSGSSATPATGTTVYDFDSHGWVTTVTRWTAEGTVGPGYETVTTYDADGNIQEADVDVDLSGTVAKTKYEWSAGNLTKETDPMGIVTTYTYDPATNDVLSKTVSGNAGDPKPTEITQLLYDTAGHLCRRIENPVGTDVEALQNPCADSLADAESRADENVDTRFSYYSTTNLLETETDPLGIVTYYSYDTYGNKTSETENYVQNGASDADTNVKTTYDYYLDNPDATSAQREAGETGHYTTETNPIDVETTYGYDDDGDVTSTFTPGDGSSSALLRIATYNSLGSQDSLTNEICETSGTTCASTDLVAVDITTTITTKGLSAGGSVIGHEVTATEVATKPTDVTDTAITATSSIYDLASDEVEIVAKDGTETDDVYDALGELVSETTPTGDRTSYAYDGLSDQTSSASTSGDNTTTTYNLDGGIVVETDGDGTTTHAYDALGRESTVTDPSGQIKTNTYDDVDRATETRLHHLVTDPDTGNRTDVTDSTTDSTFDRDGNVLTTTDPYAPNEAQVVTAAAYDALGRTCRSVKNDTINLQGLADPCTGPIDGTSATNIVTTMYFDAAGNAVAAVDAEGVVTRNYFDPAGEETKTIANCTDTNLPTTPSRDPANCQGVLPAPNSITDVVTINTFSYGGQKLSSSTTAGTTTTLQTFDGAGRVLTSTVDPGLEPQHLALETDYAYDSAGRQFATRHPDGTVTINLFNEASQISETIVNCSDNGSVPGSINWSSCKGAFGSDGTWNQTTSYTYWPDGNANTVEDPNGLVTWYHNNPQGQLDETLADYKEGSPVASQPGDPNVPTYYYYDTAGRQTAVATTLDDGSFAITRDFYDDEGNLVKEIQNCTSSGAVPHADDVANPGSCTGEGDKSASTNVVTSYTYDASGRKLSMTAPSPADDASGTATVTTDYAYDQAGNLCRVLENATVDLQSLADSCLTSVSGTTTANVSTVYDYWPNGRLKDQIAPAPTGTTSYAYDQLGHMCRQVDLNTGVDLATLANPCIDQLGDSSGEVTTWTYDANGNKATETDPDTDSTSGVTVAWFYDPAGRLCRRLAAAPGGALPAVDSQNSASTGSLASLADPCSMATSQNTDPSPDTSTSPAWAAIDTWYGHDSIGDVTQTKDLRSGKAIETSPDELGRPLVVDTYSDGAKMTGTNTTYTYGQGQETRTDPSSTGTYSFSLDLYGRESHLSDPLNPSGKGFTWTYGLSGKLCSREDPTGTIGGTGASLAGDVCAAQSLSVAPGATDPVSDNLTTYAYDPLGRTTSIATNATDGSGNLARASYSYSYNRAGNELSVDSSVATPAGVADDPNDGQTDYAYDELERLTSYTPPTTGSLKSQSYTWNSTPDRTSITTGNTTLRVIFGAGDRATSDSDNFNYTYDGEGRLTAIPGETLSWDNLGRLNSVTLSDGTLVTYAYDPLDRLQTRTVQTQDDATATTTFAYVGTTNTVASESTGSVTTDHATDLNGADLYELSSADGSSPVFLGRNAHGDLTWATGADGSVVGYSDLDPFGNLLNSGGTMAESRWQGSWQDSTTGLYYVVARWYAPTLGSFLDRDPLAGETTDPESRDAYIYGKGDVVDQVDPSGRCSYADGSEGCSGDQGDASTPLDVPVMLQTNSTWRKKLLGFSKKDTIKSDGCDLTSIAMIMSYYWQSSVSKHIDPETLNTFFQAQKAFDNPDNITYNQKVARLTGLSYKDLKFGTAVYTFQSPSVRAVIPAVRSSLLNGYPLIANVRLSSTDQHYVVVVALTDSDFIINDPAQPDPKGMTQHPQEVVSDPQAGGEGLFATYGRWQTLPLARMWSVSPRNLPSVWASQK
jgi:RHS repeat-associated protein